MIRSLDKLRTAHRLGFANILQVLGYRAAVKTGLYRHQLPAGSPIVGPFVAFAARNGGPGINSEPGYWRAEAEAVLAGRLRLFSDQVREVGFPPDWTSNALTGRTAIPRGLHWTGIDPLGRPDDDVKGYWEPSRFDGLVALTLGWLVSQDTRIAEAWNLWIANWSLCNPANLGVNWLCGQETGLRLLQTLLCAELLTLHSTSRVLEPLERFVTEHCRRIEATLPYAIAQDNNHGTSEAAALFAGGGWLCRRGHHVQAQRWRDLGRRRIEQLGARLIMPDGSFSQHSVNYHRLALDTLSLVEFWRRRFGDPPFSDLFNGRFRAAADWLMAVTDPESGNAPNLGANDGARIAVLHCLPYRDFRPSIALAHGLLSEAPMMPTGPWNEPLEWLRVGQAPAAAVSRNGHALFPDGGYAKLVRGRVWCLLRLPGFRFRPSHCDVLHLDLWHRSVNVLRDGGSYSYNGEPEAMRYFSGTAAHNTIAFDDRDQMPRLGRFLFGGWPARDELTYDPDVPGVRAGYRDAWGATHRRSVVLTDGGCVVRDQVAGFRIKAVLRWRLAPADWSIDGMTVSSPYGALSISPTIPPTGMAIVDGWESLQYGSRSRLPVFEVTFERPVDVTTTIQLGAA